MRNLLKPFAVMSVLGSGMAMADQESLTDIAMPAEEGEAVSCIFETASFDGVVIRAPASEHMAADKLHELEQYFGKLPDGDIDMVKIRYSMCGSDGYRVEEYFDRVDVQSYLGDQVSLAPGAVQAFTEAKEMLAEIPCTDSNREWIYKTVDGPETNSLELFCGAK